MDPRAFENNYPDSSSAKILTEDGMLPDELETKFDSKIESLLHKLEKGYEKDVDWRDLSVYTGTAGVALMYYHLYCTMGAGMEDSEEEEDASPTDDPYFSKALKYVERQIADMKRKRVTFLCGDPGPLALAAVLFHKLKRKDDVQMCIRRLMSRSDDVVGDDSLPDEMLFGRAGFLWSLLYLRKNLGPTFVEQSAIKKVFNEIIKSGEKMAAQNKSKHPLQFAWHEKEYLGAAHGYAGIFYTLMLVVDDEVQGILEKKVKPMIEHLMTLKFESGNFPSSVDSSNGDKLVHWCHGAPGWVYMFLMAHKQRRQIGALVSWAPDWVYMFLMAHERFKDEKFLKAAKSCADVIWKRGLLKKGYGLCHGVAGNAYAFLALFRATKDKSYLHKALKFAEWCMDYGSHGCRDPDRPWSLFEGLAGVIYLLADMLDPINSKFPALEL